MPHTSTLRSMSVRHNGSTLLYDRNDLTIDGYNGDLVFYNLDQVHVMRIRDVSQISLSELQKLKSLRNLHVQRCDNMFTAELDDSIVLHSIQNLVLEELCIQGELFSKVLKFFPALRKLNIQQCRDLFFLPVKDGGGLRDLTMLQSFTAVYCRKMFSQWPMGEGGAHTIKPFPPSLTELEIREESSMKSITLLSNLTCLTNLSLVSCSRKLTMYVFNPLMTVNLKELAIYNYNGESTDKESISIAGDLLLEVARSKLIQAGSFQLKRVQVDSISAMLVAPICSHIADTLHSLLFSFDNLAESFTEEQEQALELLTSLQELAFHNCYALRSLPQGLHHISSLRKLQIAQCYKIQSLPPKEGLPTSLQALQLR